MPLRTSAELVPNYGLRSSDRQHRQPNVSSSSPATLDTLYLILSCCKVVIQASSSKHLVVPSEAPRQARNQHRVSTATPPASQQAQARACRPPRSVHIRYQYSHACEQSTSCCLCYHSFSHYFQSTLRCACEPRNSTPLDCIPEA